MAFTKVDELTINEALALAFVEFKYRRFNEKELATHLSLFLSDQLRPGTFMTVGWILEVAVVQGLLEVALGPQGGEVFELSLTGAELLSNVDLPVDLFVERNRLDRERNAEASANAGPPMLQLLAMIPPDKREFQHARTYVESVFSQWRDQGWLFSEQVEKIAKIGTRYGFFFSAHHYVGRAMDEWRQPYIEADACSFFQARDTETIPVKAAPCLDREQIRAAALTENRLIKVRLEEMERAGGLDQLEQLVAAVFPGTTLTRLAKSSAYAGAGSKALRVCLAALAFGKPPALVWKKCGPMSQPDAESEQWQALLNHSAFQAVKAGNS